MAYQLKKMQLSDSKFIQSLFQDAEVMRFIGPVMTDEKAQKTTRSMHLEAASQSAVYWMIVRSSDNVRLGLTSVHWCDKKRTIKLGIMVAVEFQNKGVFKVAQAAAIEQAKHGFPVATFVAYTQQQNRAANHCYSQLGFETVRMEKQVSGATQLLKWQADAGKLP